MADQQTQMDLEALRRGFLERWPLDKLSTMTLEEYSNRDQTSFTYWLEKPPHLNPASPTDCEQVRCERAGGVTLPAKFVTWISFTPSSLRCSPLP